MLESYEMNWNNLQDLKYIHSEALYALTQYGKTISLWALLTQEQLKNLANQFNDNYESFNNSRIITNVSNNSFILPEINNLTAYNKDPNTQSFYSAINDISVISNVNKNINNNLNDDLADTSLISNISNANISYFNEINFDNLESISKKNYDESSFSLPSIYNNSKMISNITNSSINNNKFNPYTEVNSTKVLNSFLSKNKLGKINTSKYLNTNKQDKTNTTILNTDKTFLNRNEEVNISISKLLDSNMLNRNKKINEDSNLESTYLYSEIDPSYAEDLLIIGEVYSEATITKNTVNINNKNKKIEQNFNYSNIFDTRQKILFKLKRLLSNSNITECFDIVKGIKDYNVMEIFVQYFFIDNKEILKNFSYNFYHCYVFLNLAVKLWNTQHKKYHKIALIVFKEMLYYLFNKITQEVSTFKMKPNNGLIDMNEELFFGNDNEKNNEFKELNFIITDNSINISKKEKIDFIILLFKKMIKSKTLINYCNVDISDGDMKGEFFEVRDLFI